MKDETGKIIFDAEEQAVVDKIVQERLARHKPEDYDHLKEIEKELEDFGWKGNAAEKKEAIKAYKQQLKTQQEIAELEEKAKTTGKDPEVLKELSDLKKELAEIKGERQAQKQAEEAKTTAEKAWKEQLKEFGDKYADVDINKVYESNEKFKKFYEKSNPALSLIDVYESFMEFATEAEKEAIAKIKTNTDRSTSSGRQSGDASGGTYGLTDRQQILAKENGMSLKEYAEFLKLVRK